MRREIIEHLEKDEILKRVIHRVELQVTEPNHNIFQSLVNTIISQQISVKAAEAIYYRLVKIFNPDFQSPTTERWNQYLGTSDKITADQIIEAGEEVIKQAGLTRNKAKYIMNVAQFAKEYGLSYDKISEMSDIESMEYMTQIKGVGVWTAKMIQMFCMGKEDIFPVEDLGVRNGVVELYNLKDPNPSKNKSNHSKQLRMQVSKIGEKWRPFRSYACYYIWQFSGFDNTKQESE
jgi:DNA-3-methyladenine glycosylase II